MVALLLTAPLWIAGCQNLEPFVGTEALEPHRPVPSRFLHQRGRQLVGPDGVSRVLRSVNLGGWLHWESWMFGGGLDLTRLDQGSEGQLLGRFRRYYGERAARRFQQAIHEGYITDRDLREILQRGYDSVRLPLNHQLLEEEGGWERLREVVDQIGRADLGVFLDMHAAPGGQSKLFTADPDPILLWDSPAHQDRLVEIWTRIAREYRDHPRVLGYDLLNEPAPERPEQLLGLYRRLIEAIRRHDREHLVVLEGSALSRDFNLFQGRLDRNQVYSPHVYLWVGWPDRRWLERLGRLSKLHDTPIWVGEFGEDRLGDLEFLRKGFEEFSGWAVWSWKRVAGGAAGSVNHFEAPADWRKLVRSLHPRSETGAVMTEEQAFQALESFLEAAGRYTPHPGMARALGLREAPGRGPEGPGG